MLKSPFVWNVPNAISPQYRFFSIAFAISAACAAFLSPQIGLAQKIDEENSIQTQNPENNFQTSKNSRSLPVTVGATSDSNASPPASSPRTRRERTKRTITNREFSDKEKIILLLNAHCDFPTKDDLLQTTPEAEKYLLEIVDDESVLLSVRMRAVQALSYFSTPQNRETLENILAHPERAEHTLMLIQAIRSYTIIAPDLAPKTVEPFLSSPSDFIRFITIASLKNCPGDSALQVLNNRYQIETNRFFKMRLKQAIDGHCKSQSYCNP